MKDLLLTLFPWTWGAALSGGSMLILVGIFSMRRKAVAPASGLLSRRLVIAAVVCSAMVELFLLGPNADRPLATFVILLIPVAVTASPLMAEQSDSFRLLTGIAALVMMVVSFLTGFSVGAAYQPAILLLLFAGMAEWQHARKFAAA